MTRSNLDGASVVSVDGVAGEAGADMDPTASVSCTVDYLDGPTRWATGMRLVLVYTVAGVDWACPSVVSTTAKVTSVVAFRS